MNATAALRRGRARRLSGWRHAACEQLGPLGYVTGCGDGVIGGDDVEPPRIRLVATQAPDWTVLIRIMVGAVFLSEGLQKFLFAAERGAGRFARIGAREG